MIVWRISNHRVLDGAGGLRAPGRWHTRGRCVVYCAQNPATALLEVLVHAEIDMEEIPAALRFLEIAAPDSLAVETPDIHAIGRGWQTNTAATRHAGDEWLRSGRTALLRVPSVIVPATWNILVNPRHPHAAQVRILRIHRHPVDLRLRQ